jgi:hypothetical protein
MFLHLLNPAQKKSFLVLAQKISMIDGEDGRRELDRLDHLKIALGLPEGPDMRAVLGDLDIEAFDTRQSRSIAMMELLSLAYIDDYLHEAESDLIGDIAVAFGFGQEDLNKMAEWAMSSLELVTRGETLMKA